MMYKLFQILFFRRTSLILNIK